MPDDFAQLVKQQADIVRIVADYLKLRKTGVQNYTGLCPFHKEKTGSFSVNATHGYYYCFGCHEKGDVFNFVMKMESLSFPEAVRAVAAKSGIPEPKREFNSPEEARLYGEAAGLRRQLLDLHEAAAQYFEAALKSPEAARAREYLTGRCVSAETIRTFRIGYAPADFNHMRERLQPHFPEEVLRASGLFKSKDQEDGSPGQLYAFFRKRIAFPIANEQGKIIAFTARALEEVDDKGRPLGKYVNSPESALYTKGNVLFNLDKAKAEMRKSDFAVLVEGQMDCISVYMAGIHNVLATSGTAFTEMQARLLGRFTKRVIVNFDPDAAGAAATGKVIDLLIEEDFSLKVVTLESGLDPDRFVREHGIEAYGAALRGAKGISDWVIDRAWQLFPGHTADAKVKRANFVLPYIRRTPNPIRRGEFINDAAQKLGIDSALLLHEVKMAATQRAASIPIHPRARQPDSVERFLLRALVLSDDDPARAIAAQQLAQHPEWYDGLPAAALFDALVQAPCPANPLDVAPDVDSRSMLGYALDVSDREASTSEYSPRANVSLKEQVEKALAALSDRYLVRRRAELRNLIAQAQQRGDGEMLINLQKEQIRVNREFHNR
jgi:DNA primase